MVHCVNGTNVGVKSCRPSGAEKAWNNVQKILAGVAFVESAEHSVIEIFDRADDEEAAGVFELWQVRFVFS